MNKKSTKIEKNDIKIVKNNERKIEENSQDVVDFVKSDICNSCIENNNNFNHQTKFKKLQKLNIDSSTTDNDVLTCTKSPLEKLQIFQFARKKSDPTPTNGKDQTQKFIKNVSIARLLGSTYNTKRSEESFSGSSTVKTLNGNCNERFQKCSENYVDNKNELYENSEKSDVSARALRTISKGLSKLLWKKSHSVDISLPDPEYKVAYLGNVLTGWAKGETCMEKPLATLWRNYTQNNKPDVVMRIKVCPSGLKATTRQHGLTEYWSHRITHCSAPKNYPRIFCWIYRHEGRKLKHELRCHAVLCSKENISEVISKTLRENLARALREFKRDKVNRQNARLSLVNSVYENPSMPRRKILLSVGSNNYRPPLERSKSAPRLMAIEEVIGEEDEEEDDENDTGECHEHSINKTSDRLSCCIVDPLYPAMTLGRRRCRKGHSIRRTGSRTQKKIKNTILHPTAYSPESEDDLDKLLERNDYNSKSPLVGELLSYFDMKLSSKTTSLLNLEHLTKDEDESCKFTSISTKPSLSMDDLDRFSDHVEDDGDVYFNQDSILDILTQKSKNHSTHMELFNDNSIMSGDSFQHEPSQTDSLKLNRDCNMANSLPADSDEGSISSGCETASTVTTNLEDAPITKDDKTNDTTDHNCSHNKSTKATDLIAPKRTKPLRHLTSLANEDSDSEFSDESGYVEYQDGGTCRI